MKLCVAILLLLILSGCSSSVKREGEEQNAANCALKILGQKKLIKGGYFTMGANPLYPEEGPEREVRVADFNIDVHEVTNRQYAEFVEATKYVTTAERPPFNIESLPEPMREPGSAVFSVPDADNPNWWRWQTGANWRQPLGPRSTTENNRNDPVVQISYADASAYAEWKGGQLPSEEQWEFAARAGSDRSEPPTNSSGQIQANHYQGAFPAKDLGVDGYKGTAPVGCFPSNRYGLYDMIGNVWEWTKAADERPGSSAIVKGGSFLCAQNYCQRYRPSARQLQERDMATNHIGFRLVYPASRKFD